MPCSLGGKSGKEIAFVGLMQVLRREQVQIDTPGGHRVALTEVPSVSI